MKKNLVHGTMSLCLILLMLAGCKSKKSKTEMQAAPGYKKAAVMFCLSQFSNVNYGLETTMPNLRSHLDSSISSLLANSTIQKLVGKWNVVWGPVNYTNDSTTNDTACVSDNAMLVLKGKNPSNPSNDMYVIAIAATNFSSPYDWADEDFQSASMVQWPATTNLPNIAQFSNNAITDSSVTNAGMYISAGSATGLNILYNMTDPESGMTLMQFLKSTVGNSSSAIEVATTGHSLAGALGPSLALSLKDNQPYWNPSGKCLLTSYATAGPSPGNNNWASYFSNQIGSNFNGAYNSLDVVPHGFQYSQMMQLPALYDSLILPVSGKATNCLLGDIITCAAGNVQGFNYASIFPSSSFFTTPISYNVDSMYQSGISLWNGLSTSKKVVLSKKIDSNCDIWPWDDHGPYFAVAVCYGALAADQHSTAYINFYGVQQVNNIYLNYLAADAGFGITTFLWDMYGNPLISGCIF